jgi:hypothetical protein
LLSRHDTSQSWLRRRSRRPVVSLSLWVRKKGIAWCFHLGFILGQWMSFFTLLPSKYDGLCAITKPKAFLRVSMWRPA